MSWPINATLYVEVFTPTGNQGEYAFTNGIFNNQADGTGNGAFDAAVGANIYVQATSLNSGAPVPGVMHRYKLTQCVPVDTNTLSGVMIWSEPGVEEDNPTSGSFCLYAQATSGHGFGLVPSEQTYPVLPSGSTIQSLVLDVRDITDTLGPGGTGSGEPAPITVTGTTTNGSAKVLGPSQALGLLPSNQTLFVTTVLGRSQANPDDRCAFTIEGMAYMNSITGQLTIMGGTVTTVVARSNALWEASVVANTTTEALDVTVTGSAGSALDWTAVTTQTLVRFPDPI